MTLRSYLRCVLLTTVNVVLNALTLGRFLWLEGRVRRGVFRNWARRFRHTPGRVAFPASEAELAEVIAGGESVRVFGGGHSFNPAVRTRAGGTLVSLDRMTGVAREAGSRDRFTVKGGTRVREVSEALLREGMAFSGLPSHDAQSIAGILATDAHGTGRDWGFMSEHVVSMRIVDGTGKTHVVDPSDALGRAAIGGIGAVGVITEVTVEAVPRFDIEQKIERSDLATVERNLAKLHAGNEHLSLYLFPFTGTCQVLTWNRADRPPSTLGDLREWLAIAFDAMAAAWLGNALAYTGLLPRLSTLVHRFRRGTNLVLESARGFNRSLYPLHQELEFTVPFEAGLATCREFIALYERMYRAGTALPYLLCEVRFTPAGHDRSLLGPGRDRRCCWIDLVCNDSAGFAAFYAEAEALARRIGARPHLGKYCESVDAAEMHRLYGPDFTTFQRLAGQYDPRRRFVNEFTSRVFGL